MKRINNRKIRKLCKRNKSRELKACIRKAVLRGDLLRVPEKFRSNIKIDCPTQLSLTENFTETIQFFTEMKNLGNHILQRRDYRPTTPIPFSIGIGNLESISVRCAVMLAAELDRLRQLSSANLVYTGSKKLENEALILLLQIGCFELLGIDEPELNETLSGPEQRNHRIALRLMSGRKIDNNKFEKFESELTKICNNFNHLKVLNGAMGEAILNVKNHAYISGMKLRYPSPGKRWWAIASINPTENKLKIIVYDQGHGIAKTLPQSGFFEHIAKYISAIGSRIIKTADLNDRIMLEAVIKRAIDNSEAPNRRTRTGLKGRGKGLGDIVKPVKMVEGSSIRIASGEAEVTFAKDHGIVGRSLPKHLGGTLIEWIFEV